MTEPDEVIQSIVSTTASEVTPYAIAWGETANELTVTIAVYSAVTFTAGEVITINFVDGAIADRAGNELNGSVSVTVQDTTAPNPPFVYPVYSNNIAVTGFHAEFGATVTIYTGEGEYYGSVQEDGTFSVPIPAQVAGTSLYVTVTDAAGNESQATVVNVLLPE